MSIILTEHPMIQQNINKHLEDLVNITRSLNNGEYAKIFSDNLEKLKTELTSHGEIILTTLVNDKAYQHIADIHLNSLKSNLTETYDKFIQNNNNLILDIKILILDIKNLKNECDNHKKYINTLENKVAINSILLGTIIGIYGIYKLFQGIKGY